MILSLSYNQTFHYYSPGSLMSISSEALPSANCSDSPARALAALREIPDLEVRENVELRHYTRFGIGGAADLLAETSSPDAFAAAIELCRGEQLTHYVLGDGSNVIVSDEGFRGLILRFVADNLALDGNQVIADAGASLQALVDFTVDAGLKGLETLARIPGSVGAAIYGNAGAYGHSISERVEQVKFFDGSEIRGIDNAGCRFEYRGSVFKNHKDWVIFQCCLKLDRADASELRKRADEITAIRDEKFPPTMRCAGSIFKNLHLKDLPQGIVAQVPEKVTREGKVPAAYFLEQVGAKGMCRGGIEIASYHANLIYNTGNGTASELRGLISELKRRVRERYGFDVEEEVQYVGEF